MACCCLDCPPKRPPLLSQGPSRFSFYDKKKKKQCFRWRTSMTRLLMSDWKVTLRLCCWVETFPPSLRGREKERERKNESEGAGAVRQAAVCPQDAHKYPCKLQFKRNQYKWQVANATIWGSNEGVLAGGLENTQITANWLSGVEVQVRGKCVCTDTHAQQGQ